MSGVDPEMVRRLRSFRRVLLWACAAAAGMAIWEANPAALVVVGAFALAAWVLRP